MKVVFLVSAVLICFASLVFFIFHFSNRYNSAFEADQKCHSDISLNYADITSIGCDHDLETRQWILFQTGLNGEPAKVLNRYKY